MLSKNPLPNWLTQQLNAQDIAHLPSWLQSLRKEQGEALLKHGLPYPNHENWKYADLSFITKNEYLLSTKKIFAKVHENILENSIHLSLVNGFFNSDSLNLSDSNVIISSLKNALQSHPNLVMNHLLQQIQTTEFPFASLNTAFLNDGLFIYVPDDCQLLAPVHLFVTTQEHNALSQPHCIIILGNNSKLCLIEEYKAEQNSYLNNTVHRIYLNKNACLNYYKLQQEAHQASHMASVFVEQEENSQFAYVNISLGSQFARDEININLKGKAATCKTAGFNYLTQKNQYIDHHITVNHAAPQTKSEMLYKGILAGKSRSVFNGRLHVAKQAQKISAYQANHNILLSNTAEVYSKPELEIYADDVKCKHGATTGQLDESALFYLRARGINKEEAVNMLIESFAAEIVARISHADFQKRIQNLVRL